MTKKLKIVILLVLGILLSLGWLAFAITDTKNQPVNYWWQSLLAATALLGGCFGLATSRHWSWLRSDVGKGVFFLSAGILSWGVGQILWTYALLHGTSTQVPLNSNLAPLDIIYLFMLPLIIYGMSKLSTVTGAKFVFSKTSAKLLVAMWSLIMIAVTVTVIAHTGSGISSFFSNVSFWRGLYVLELPVLDAINLVIAVAIVGLSWRLIGGRFRLPILAVAMGFVLLFLSDFAYSYYDIRGQYFNGHWSDLLYVATITVFSIGVCSLDPPRKAVKVV